MTKQQFVDNRTAIISKMLDNPDEHGIYPTTTCFAELDDLYDEMAEIELDTDPKRSAAQKLRDEEESLDMSTLDLTRQTITLGSRDNPMWTIMKGHVGPLTFDRAWKAEGWSAALGDNPTEEEAKRFGEGLKHDYGAYDKDSNKWNFVKKDALNAEPITVMDW